MIESIPTVDSHISSPESSLRRTPYPSVKKRSQIQPPHRSGFQQQAFRRHRIFDENDLRSSTHNVVYDSSKPLNTTTTTTTTLTINPIRRGILSSDDNNMLLTSFSGNGNESDYDNNQCNQDHSNISKYLSSTTTTRLIKLPVNDLNQSNELTHTDDLLLGDQNEIVLNNNHSNDDGDEDNDNNEARVDLSNDNDDIDGDENTIQSTINNNQQSDNNIISSINSLQTSSNQRINNNRTSIESTSTIDDNIPSNYITYRRDPLAARRLLDIRSHLLLNTTLDAT